MGGVLSLLVSKLFGEPASPSVANRQAALDKLRYSDQIMASKIDAKRRRVADVDRDMVEVGLRMQHAHNRLSQADAQTFRALYRDRQLLLESRQRLIDVHGNLRAQIMMIEDSVALLASADAMSAGAREHADDAESIETMMGNVVRMTHDALSSQRNVEAMQRITKSVDTMDDDALERELGKLMGDDEFIGQFDESDLERARRALLLRLPSVPSEAPSAGVEVRRRPVTTTEAVSEMGL